MERPEHSKVREDAAEVCWGDELRDLRVVLQRVVEDRLDEHEVAVVLLLRLDELPHSQLAVPCTFLLAIGLGRRRRPRNDQRLWRRNFLPSGCLHLFLLFLRWL